MSSREIMNAKGFAVMDNDERVFRDPVVKRVVDKFRTRSDAGFEKYGTTLHEERTTKMKSMNFHSKKTLKSMVLFFTLIRSETGLKSAVYMSTVILKLNI